MEDPLILMIVIFSAVSCVTTIILTILLVKYVRNKMPQEALSQLRSELLDEIRYSKSDLLQNNARAIQTLGRTFSDGQLQLSRELIHRQDSLQSAVGEMMHSIDNRFHQFALQNEQQLSGIRMSVEAHLTSIQESNAAKLEEMRIVVDEKLQKTLEGRLNQSFALVSSRLEEVYKGLGEMKALASGVGDLKKVLSNVKSRGVLGEVQLGAILENLLAPGQYAANVVTKRGSRAFVEYAVLMPGEGKTPVYLPIDAKFPLDAYTQLTDAQEIGEVAVIAAAGAQLVQRMRTFAKDIHAKYIDPPYTTDFAILFLPFEGLYAEVLRLGLLEPLQRDYKISIAGPTTMAALLNSLQMGFRTLAIQKRSCEVWEVLGAVRTEFDRFHDVLGATQQRLQQAGDELDKLVGVRTRMIQRRLSQVTALDDHQAQVLLEEDKDEETIC